jgi:LCP family protein required for cell wall assembly
MSYRWLRTLILAGIIALLSTVIPVNAHPSAALLPNERVTILLFGTDHFTRQKDPETKSRIADTVMVLSIDPLGKTASVLSVNRDIYLYYPGYNRSDRISNALVIGDKIKYPGGAPLLGIKAVSRMLNNIPIQHYVTIDYDVFKTVINALGNIQVCPTEPIHDEKFPDVEKGVITVDFPTGCQELDADRLLQYTRAFRKNEADRNRRQQEVLRAVRDKVLSLGGLTSLMGNAQSIWDSFKANLETDLTFQDLVDLAQLAQDIPQDKIQFATLSEQDGYLTAQKQADGTYLFYPINFRVRTLTQKLFPAAKPAK